MAVSDARPEALREASRESSIYRRAARIEIAPPVVALTRYAPAAVLIAILLADSNRHTDPDLWGHLRFGQVFIAGRHRYVATHIPTPRRVLDGAITSGSPKS
jgi:hypothetical protein